MVSEITFRNMALALPGAVETPHFEKTSFRVRKKIFATLSIGEHKAVAKLAQADQDIFCSYHNEIIYPESGAWGKQGWTSINLKKIKTALCKEVIKTAYKTVAPKTLSKAL